MSAQYRSSTGSREIVDRLKNLLTVTRGDPLIVDFTLPNGQLFTFHEEEDLNIWIKCHRLEDVRLEQGITKVADEDLLVELIGQVALVDEKTHRVDRQVLHLFPAMFLVGQKENVVETSQLLIVFVGDLVGEDHQSTGIARRTSSSNESIDVQQEACQSLCSE